MRSNRRDQDKLRTFASYLLLAIVVTMLLWLGHMSSVANGADTTVNAGPDLTVEITIDPASPAANEEVTIHVVAKNVGDSDAGAYKVYLYVDPSERPPNSGTAGAFPIIQFPTLAAGDSVEGTRTHTFTTTGCDHILYAWIDRDGDVAESDETNNLLALPVCVGVTCEADGFEVDNDAAHAQWLVENEVQAHSLCHPTDVEAPDIDTVKFTVFTGVTYTLATSNVGVHADPVLDLADGCGLLKSSDTGTLSWSSPSSAVCYATVAQDGPSLGPLATYSLTLSSSTGVTDLFEPDDQCANARDIATTGARQTRLFQSPGDEDWVKFPVEAGDSFIAIADHPATGVKPVVTIFNSCDQVPANNSVSAGAQQVSLNAATDQIYYARIQNQNSANFGPTHKYDFSVTTSTCDEDALEQDDNASQAKEVTVGAPAQTHAFCPASDEDWVKFTATAGTIYVLQTSKLAFASDTLITLYNSDGVSQIAQNDDYGYTSASRVIWEAPAAGVYFARIRHADIVASGPNTQYDFSIQTGYCSPDNADGDGDNGPGDAIAIPTDGSKQPHNFCADPLRADLGDQDWMRFDAVTGGRYQIYTSDLGDNSDTTLELYAANGNTLIQRNDDVGQGRLARLDYTATVPGAYFVRVTQFNSALTGSETNYDLSVFGQDPPTPTPTPTNTPVPTPVPTATNTPEPSNVKTLILVNKERVSTLYSPSAANQLMTKLLTLADDAAVNGLVVQVENDPAVAGAYAAWTADADSLADNDKANNVIAAVRNRVLAFAGSMPQLAYVVIAGDDRVIPFRRVLDRVAPTGPSAESIEANYAPALVENGTVKAALAANMILSDDYLVDKEPSQWEDRQHNQYELYLPDYAVGRLVETPAQIMAFIDAFLASDKQIDTSKVLVTGYDFMQDSANVIKTLYSSDNTTTVNGDFVSSLWQGAAFRSLFLDASPPFDVYSVNGHSNHIAQGAPNENVGEVNGNGTQASAIAASATNLTGALVYSAGCHSGVNDPGVLDLAEAFLQKKANYVGNTGFGWGASGIVYTEALMRNYSRELLRDTKSQIGTALVNAKKRYFSQAMSFGAFDAKILMQVAFYGLPMVSMTSGGTLQVDDPFPSAEREFTPPSSFGSIAEGNVGYQLPNSFGSFGASTGEQGVTYDLNDHTAVSAGEPVQPLYFSNAAAPAAGDLRGVVFLGGVYSDVVAYDPVIAHATNEYVNDNSEPPFSSDSFYPALPYTIRSGRNVPGVADTVVMSLGQFQSNPDAQSAGAHATGTDRIYEQMSFGTYYSDSPDRNAANISFVDGVLLGPPGTTSGQAQIKVETQDSSGINRVVVAYHEGEGEWTSEDLTYDNVAQKWSLVITGSIQTEFFVQVVDNAGNVAVNNNKGHNYPLSSPVELASGAAIAGELYIPFIGR